MKNWPENSPKFPQKWKVDLKNENLEKNGKFWKSSDNLEKIKKLPKNPPQMISKLKNLHQKWKFWKSSDNLEEIKNLPKNSPPNDLKTEKFTSKMKILKKMKFFKIFRKSRKKWKIAPKIHQNDRTMSPKMFKLKKVIF